MQFELTPTQRKIVRLVRDTGHGDIWVVGGACRDLLLNKKPKDVDLVTNLPHETVKLIVEGEGLKVIPDETALSHGIVRVVDQDTGEPIDVASTRRDVWCDGRHAKVEYTPHLREDLARRDLTINAIAMKIHPNGEVDGTVFDHHNGQMHLHTGLICFVGDPGQRIREDALRMVRACRFMALSEKMNMAEPERRAIRENAARITEVSKERIRDEVLKALSYDCPSKFFRSLYDCGLLGFVIPDLLLAVGVEQNEFHAETVFEHLMYAVDASVDLTSNALLRLACLMHDIGKPVTRSTDTNNRVHFYKHEIEGARLVRDWMRDLRFSKKEVEYVTKLVRHHQWRFETNSKGKTIRRWLQQVGPEWKDLITLRAADRKGNMAKQHLPVITRKMRELMDRAQDIIDSGNPLFKEDLAINGHDIQALGVKPGSVYKTIFSNMLGIVVTDPSKNTREWLSAYVKRNFVDKETEQQ